MCVYGHKCVIMSSAKIFSMSLIYIWWAKMQKIIYMQILPHELLPNNVSQVMLVSK